jgi:ferrous iron transport protein B
LALAGNPNVGKTTIFNGLTGSHQQVGNWPGKTVEQKIGVVPGSKPAVRLVDLPGTYSLTAVSQEEVIAREFVVESQPDAVIVTMDACNLERNLYLFLQISELTSRVVVALTMMDVARDNGIVVEAPRLAELLGVPVVAMWPGDETAKAALLREACLVASGVEVPEPSPVCYGLAVESQIHRLEQLVASLPHGNYEPRWLATKLLENDPVVVNSLPGLGLQVPDLSLEIAGARYDKIRAIVAEVIGGRRTTSSITEKLDRIFLHPMFGLPILAAAAFLLFFLTFSLSNPLVRLLDALFSWAGGRVELALMAMRAPAWLVGLVVDGVVGGVGSVLAFFPLMGIFFFLYSFLQDSGYMARAAFLTDRVMRAMGLHGKAFFTLLSGYGCNVPGVMSTRILDNEADRKTAVVLNPLIPCAARLGVMSFFVAAFFPGLAGTFVMLGLLAFDLGLIFLVGRLIRRHALKGEPAPFVMELPGYRLPALRNLVIPAWTRITAFFHKAASVILAASVIIWLLSNVPYGTGIEHTAAGFLGRSLAPIGRMMGFDWRIMLALVFGIAAKETALSTLGVLYGASSGGAGLAGVLVNNLSRLQALSFLVVFMLYVPCLATMAAMHRETRDWKLTLAGTAGTIALALLIGTIVFQTGRLL